MKKFDWKIIIVELLIVFIGVYGAFVLNNYRQGIEDDKARLKY